MSLSAFFISLVINISYIFLIKNLKCHKLLGLLSGFVFQHHQLVSDKEIFQAGLGELKVKENTLEKQIGNL